VHFVGFLCVIVWCTGNVKYSAGMRNLVSSASTGTFAVRHESLSLMKRQFAVTHTISRTEIPTLLDSWVTNTPSVKMLCPQKYCLSLYFRNIITCLIVGLLKIGQVSFLSFKTVYWWATTNWCFYEHSVVTWCTKRCSYLEDIFWQW
jgi:hypothetical protein